MEILFPWIFYQRISQFSKEWSYLPYHTQLLTYSLPSTANKYSSHVRILIWTRLCCDFKRLRNSSLATCAREPPISRGSWPLLHSLFAHSAQRGHIQLPFTTAVLLLCMNLQSGTPKATQALCSVGTSTNNSIHFAHWIKRFFLASRYLHLLLLS